MELSKTPLALGAATLTFLQANTANSFELIKSGTSNDYTGVKNQQEMQCFLNAAVVECKTDAAFVLAHKKLTWT